MQTRDIGLILLISLLCISLINSSIPYNNPQFIAQTTDLNYIDFVNGVYDGNFLFFDGNKLSITAFDINSYDINWSQLINFPTGCEDNQVVKIVGSSLVCVDVVVPQGMTQDFNLGENSFFVGDNEQGYDSAFNIWGFDTAYVNCIILGDNNSYCSASDFPNPDLSAYLPLDWVGGNITFVPITGNLATYVSNATAGDTLILSAGTYTITSELAVDKKLAIIGQGKDITTITTSTNIHLFSNAGSGTYITDLTFSYACAATSTKNIVTLNADTIINNVKIVSTAIGATNRVVSGIRVGTASTNYVWNTDFVLTGAVGSNRPILMDASATYLNIYNCNVVSSGSTASSSASVIQLPANSPTLNIYNSNIYSSTSNQSTIEAGTGGTANIYNSIINASGPGGYDLKSTGGTINAYSTTLINGTIYGTINYGGTFVADTINVDNNIYVGGYVHATDYITGSMVADITDGKSALSKLNNIGDWLKVDTITGKKVIDYNKHYAYFPMVTSVVDYSKPVLVDKEVTYPYTIDIKENGLSMETRVAEMEKMIYELKQLINGIQTTITSILNRLTGAETKISNLETENDLIKSELCKKDSSYKWCLTTPIK